MPTLVKVRKWGNSLGLRIAPTQQNPSGEGVFFCDAVRQIDWRERAASHAGQAPRDYVEDALDRLLAAMEEDEQD